MFWLAATFGVLFVLALVWANMERDAAKAWEDNAKLLGETLSRERLREHNWEARAQSAEAKLAKVKKAIDPK